MKFTVSKEVLKLGDTIGFVDFFGFVFVVQQFEYEVAKLLLVVNVSL